MLRDAEEEATSGVHLGPGQGSRRQQILNGTNLANRLDGYTRPTATLGEEY